MCARVAINLKLFDLIAGADGAITANELASKTKSDEQLIGNIANLYRVTDC
jgi:hypothetical protein